MPELKKIVLPLVLAVALAFFCTVSAFSFLDVQSLRGTELYVYNWGEYISDGSEGSLDVNKAFEEKYGISVVYDTFDNNEVMYTKLKGGGVSYDVVIPSDYMIERMVAEKMLQKIDFSNVPNYKNIDAKYKSLPFDPNNEYSVPYNVGTIGLIYNTKKITTAPDSWDALWNPDYTGQILMINNPRDAFAIAHAILGIDCNTTAKADWESGAQKLKEQKSLVQSYVNDEVYNKMESGEAALAPYYVGDFLTMRDNNPDLAFVFPKEGVNFFVDSMCIPQGAKNKTAAELYINFLLEPDIALANAEYICYASPNTAVTSNPDYSLAGDEFIYPPDSAGIKTTIYRNLPQGTLNLMSSLWDDVKNYSGEADDDPKEGLGNGAQTAIGLSAVAVAAAAYLVFRAVRKKKREA